ncbi:MAG: nucleoside monophosphate kinase, partial [Candidatus Aenigmatarchaeota archaeon]
MKLVFLGPPGAGKGTYASRICEKKGWAHISTGDILREEIRKGSKIGIEAKKYVDTGQLVPDEIIIGILKERLKKQDCKNGFILDGFPRTVSQAIALEKITTIDAVLNLSIPNYVLISKILGRRTC